MNEIEPVQKSAFQLHRRLDRMGRLLGFDGMSKLANSHVMIIGMGGVGSWAAESLVRSGVGHITLVDFDEVCITNANRQLHAMQGVVGKKKVLVMQERLQKINPLARIEAIPLFYNKENAENIFNLNQKPDFVLDAIDNLTAKCHLLEFVKTHQIPVVTSGGAASRMDPLAIEITDLSETHTDPMLHQIRKTLRTDHGFVREGLFQIPCVFSTEVPSKSNTLPYDLEGEFQCVCPQGQNDFHSCKHRNIIHGTASFVTGTFGLVMASYIVKKLVQTAGEQEQQWQ